MVFKILPKFKTHQIGDKIHYQDTIYLKNCTFGAFISFEKEKEEFEYFNEPFSCLLPHHNQVDSNYEKKRIFLSSEKEKDSVFTIKLFQKNIMSSNFISGFEYVTLEHTELQALLTADLKFNCNNQKKEFLYLRKYTGDYEEESFNFDSVWIVEPHEPPFVSEKIYVAN